MIRFMVWATVIAAIALAFRIVQCAVRNAAAADDARLALLLEDRGKRLAAKPRDKFDFDKATAANRRAARHDARARRLAAERAKPERRTTPGQVIAIRPRQRGAK